MLKIEFINNKLCDYERATPLRNWKVLDADGGIRLHAWMPISPTDDPYATIMGNNYIDGVIRGPRERLQRKCHDEIRRYQLKDGIFYFVCYDDKLYQEKTYQCSIRFIYANSKRTSIMNADHVIAFLTEHGVPRIA